MTSARLELYCHGSGTGSNDALQIVQRATGPWDIQTKWQADNSEAGTSTSPIPVDPMVLSLRKFYHNQTLNQWFPFDVLSAVKKWVADPSTNFGLPVRCPKPDGGAMDVYFRLSDYLNAQFRPKLTVVYQESVSTLSERKTSLRSSQIMVSRGAIVLPGTVQRIRVIEPSGRVLVQAVDAATLRLPASSSADRSVVVELTQGTSTTWHTVTLTR